MINYIYYPNNDTIPQHLIDIVNAFKVLEKDISSEKHTLSSDDVLSKFVKPFKDLGYNIETGKRKEDKISIPVLYGVNGKIVKKFEADAYNQTLETVVEIEAGRGVLNNQFLKDYFEACMMLNVQYCVIAVRNIYGKTKDFEYVKNFFDALYTSRRITTYLKGLLIIGY